MGLYAWLAHTAIQYIVIDFLEWMLEQRHLLVHMSLFLTENNTWIIRLGGSIIVGSGRVMVKYLGYSAMLHNDRYNPQ